MSTEIGQIKSIRSAAARERERVSHGPDETGERRPGGVAATVGTDQVRLSDSALRIREAAARLAELPGIDQARVDAIREALGRGTYRIDPARLADRLLAQEQSFSAESGA